MAYKNGLSTEPNVVAELGPGDSIGIGLAALLSGAAKYYALDIVEYASNKRNLEIFDELLHLFMKNEGIPDEAEFPEVKPYLDTYDFPHHILTDARLKATLKDERVKAIRNTIINVGKVDAQIAYFSPWFDTNVIKEETVDIVYSQAVMEHVDDLLYTYQRLYRWLKPNGFMSHQIDFRSHGTAKEWNGHWGYSDFMWKLVKGRRPYLLNRQPHSIHIEIMKNCGFEVVCDKQVKDFSGIQKSRLATSFMTMSDDDLATSGAFIQAVKK